MVGKFNFAIDGGGTFTDILCLCPNGQVRTLKLLSENPDQYKDAPREGIRQILSEVTGTVITSDSLIDTSEIGWIRMGTTVATNALLERKGDPVALIVNSGFKDLLYIGNQARSKIFEINIVKPPNLYQTVVEVDCRIVPAQKGMCELNTTWNLVHSQSKSDFLEICPLNADVIREQLQQVLSQGITSIAVVLAHSYAYAQHEIAIGTIARELGFSHISLSHEAMPMIKLVSRGYTACVDAYLTPHVERYIQNFKAGFKNSLKDIDVLFMQSDGGLTQMDDFRAARAILSGPAGGVVGYAITGSKDTSLPLIGFDMGGTSTDVSRFSGRYDHVVESTTAGITIQVPQLDINTVAAGGGSMLIFRSGLFIVGPESAGAHPGPACYKKGGPLTVTDANLMLGRLLPEFFPNIFGKNANEPLDFDAMHEKFIKLQGIINENLAGSGKKVEHLYVENIAMGFIRVANESMCRSIRALTQAKGLDSSTHALACFGGAGGQHACSIARELGMSQVLVHKYAGILSAYGMALADVVCENQEPCGLEYCEENFPVIFIRLNELSKKCKQNLLQQGFDDEHIVLEPYLHLRYDKTDCALMCEPTKRMNGQSDLLRNYGDFNASFLAQYKLAFGFIIPDRKIIIDDIRMRANGKTNPPVEPDCKETEIEQPQPEKYTKVFFDGLFYCETPVFICSKLNWGHRINGPAILIDELSTILVEPGCTAEVTLKKNLIIHIGCISLNSIDDHLNTIQLSIFGQRFMSIAEQMGRVLQRTSISTNIKERLDFSCALFGPDGGLVSNAPHIPVHLGAMQETVQYQLTFRGSSLKNGDVLLANHPKAGGSHLPDFTVITPVFYKDELKPVFFVASRGHHADIGGITPGSMPPHSKYLAEEGAAFKSFLLVENGTFMENDLIKQLTTPNPIKGACGTRNLNDNISDLKAQIAANHKGIQLVCELIDAYGLNVVQSYMKFIQQNAEVAVKDVLMQIAKDTKKRTGETILYATDEMDDGSPINLRIELNPQNGTALFDFTGSGHEVWGNCNVPRAVVLSAIIYCLRCMVGHDIPLNQGCLAPVQVIIPKNSMLDPSEEAAVVGGNVLTSQRIVDTIFKAFRICAASQGCMNNITLGDDNWGYYETVGGGSGAGPNWHGVGGTHVHMTNTRITDPEILESRYPIILKKFCLRDDQSGGRGTFNGGEGVHRQLLFRKSVILSVLTERRVLEPYGMNGGLPGKRGQNLLLKTNGRVINLGGKAAVHVDIGDIFSMKTPGGGGYGQFIENKQNDDKPTTNDNQKKPVIIRGSIFEYNQAQESA